MKHNATNFKDTFAKFTEHWSPRVIAEMNDHQFKLVKVEGEFVWHDHPDTDEVLRPMGSDSIETRFIKNNCIQLYSY